MKGKNIIKQNKMLHYDNVTKVNINKDNRSWPQIPDHPYKIIITGGLGSGKKQDDDDYSIIDKIYFKC